MLSNGTLHNPDPLPLFLQQALGDQPFVLTRVAGDASFRCYYRVTTEQNAFILMDAPPEKENSLPFVNIAQFLHRFAVPVPAIVHAQLDKGYILLQDFGDVTFLEAVRQHDSTTADLPSIHALYEAALSTLLQIQSTPVDGSCIAHQRFFDRGVLRQELALLTDWTIEKILNQTITPQDRQRFETVFSTLLDEVLQQPVVFVHRDYHSRNLMWHAQGVGVLDFQDAVLGPITYDLASLLRDCYVAWDRPFRDQMMQLWLEGARRHLGYTTTEQNFQKAFDWMAIQRNLKAVGIFGRLSHRDGKHGYLNDIPRTMGYVRETLPHYPELADLGRLLDRYIPKP